MIRIKKGVVISLLIACFGFFALVFSFNSINFLPSNDYKAAYSLTQDEQNLKTAKEEAISYINKIGIYDLNIEGFRTAPSVEQLRQSYITQINACTDIPSVSKLKDEAYSAIFTLNEFWLLKGEVITGDLSLSIYSGYVLTNFNTVRDYYIPLIISAESISSVNSLKQEAIEKLQTVAEVEKERKALLDYIQNAQFKNTSLQGYQNILSSFKTEKTSYAVSISSYVNPQWSKTQLGQTLSITLIEINKARSNFDLDLNILEQKLNLHKSTILTAISNETMLNILSSVFEINNPADPAVVPFMLPIDSETILEDALYEKNYPLEVINQIISLFGDYYDGVYSLLNAKTMAEVNALDTLIKQRQDTIRIQLNNVKNSTYQPVSQDKEKAKALDDFILTLSKKSSSKDIKEARETYNSLTPAQKSFVTNEQLLSQVEKEKKDSILIPPLATALIILLLCLIGIIYLIITQVILKKKLNSTKTSKEETNNKSYLAED